MGGYDLHLVGSVPLKSATDVFEVVCRCIGTKLLRIPDGETGERAHWLGWQEPTFAQHPAFEKTDQFSLPHAQGDARPRCRVKAGFSKDMLVFPKLLIADNAVRSYAEFSRLKKEGVVPAHLRFQVSVANPMAVVERFVTPDCEDEVLQAYEPCLLREIEKIAPAIPHDQLAIQWDVASSFTAPLEIGAPTKYGSTREEMMRNFAEMVVRWGNAVPADIDLLFHLCYGDNAHRHVVEPSTLDVPVDFANLLSASMSRPIQLIHMPVPRDRVDDAYFAPLARLALQRPTRICLGLIHQTDGVQGASCRISTARKYLTDFLVSTECGFGRRPPETIPELLQIHAAIADLPSSG
jgi:hypothetical protein